MRLYEGTTHIGKRRVLAKPMTIREYSFYRNWSDGSEDGPEEGGYILEFGDGNNIDDFCRSGYILWQPTALFESAYIEITG